jgi:hypothetical protein
VTASWLRPHHQHSVSEMAGDIQAYLSSHAGLKETYQALKV